MQGINVAILTTMDDLSYLLEREEEQKETPVAILTTMDDLSYLVNFIVSVGSVVAILTTMDDLSYVR